MEYMKISHTGQTRKVRTGFSWEAFLLGVLYYAYKGMWGKAVLYTAVALIFSWTLIVPLILWFWFGFEFNEEYKEFLLSEGFSVYEHSGEATFSEYDGLAKLKDLKDSGALSDEEYDKEKAKLLG